MMLKKRLLLLLLMGLITTGMCACRLIPSEKMDTPDTPSSKAGQNNSIIDDEGNTVVDDESNLFRNTTENIVYGNTFYVGASEIRMKDDESFMFYKLQNEYDGDYIAGTYEAYCGQEAVDKIVSMEEFGLTETEIENLIAANKKGYHLGDISGNNSARYIEAYIKKQNSISDQTTYQVSKDVFYCIILHDNILYMNGETEDINNTNVYIGYYIDDLKLIDMGNVNTASLSTFELKEK